MTQMTQTMNIAVTRAHVTRARMNGCFPTLRHLRHLRHQPFRLKRESVR